MEEEGEESWQAGTLTGLVRGSFLKLATHQAHCQHIYTHTHTHTHHHHQMQQQTPHYWPTSFSAVGISLNCEAKCVCVCVWPLAGLQGMACLQNSTHSHQNPGTLTHRHDSWHCRNVRLWSLQIQNTTTAGSVQGGALSLTENWFP